MMDINNLGPASPNSTEKRNLSSHSEADPTHRSVSGLSYFTDLMKTSYDLITSNQGSDSQESRNTTTLPTNYGCKLNGTESSGDSIALSDSHTLLPFSGVFKKKSMYTTRSKVDMNALAHPVYAPSGSALGVSSGSNDECSGSDVARREQVIRLSPFS
jgi:hypothetical protein